MHPRHGTVRVRRRVSGLRCGHARGFTRWHERSGWPGGSAPVGLVWSVWCRAVRCRALVGSACLCARAAQTLVTLVRRTRAVTVARSRSAARGLLCLAGRQELAGGKVVPVGERLRVALLVASPGARTVETGEGGCGRPRVMDGPSSLPWQPSRSCKFGSATAALS